MCRGVHGTRDLGTRDPEKRFEASVASLLLP